MDDKKDIWENVRKPSELWQLKEVKASALTIVIGLAVTIIGSLVFKSSTVSIVISFIGAMTVLGSVQQIAKWVPINRKDE